MSNNKPLNIDKVEMNVTDRIFTWSNLLSASRIVMAPLIIWVYEDAGREPTWLLFSLIILLILSDMFDGYLARKLNQVSELGKILDPVIDKITALTLFIYAALIGLIPMWFLYGLIIRDILIISGSLLIRKKRGKVAMSVMSGKIFVNVLAVYWVVVIFLPGQELLAEWLLWANVVLMTYSLGDYIRRFWLIDQKGAEFN